MSARLSQSSTQTLLKGLAKLSPHLGAQPLTVHMPPQPYSLKNSLSISKVDWGQILGA